MLCTRDLQRFASRVDVILLDRMIVPKREQRRSRTVVNYPGDVVKRWDGFETDVLGADIPSSGFPMKPALESCGTCRLGRTTEKQ